MHTRSSFPLQETFFKVSITTHNQCEKIKENFNSGYRQAPKKETLLLAFRRTSIKQLTCHLDPHQCVYQLSNITHFQTPNPVQPTIQPASVRAQQRNQTHYCPHTNPLCNKRSEMINITHLHLQKKKERLPDRQTSRQTGHWLHTSPSPAIIVIERHYSELENN